MYDKLYQILDNVKNLQISTLKKDSYSVKLMELSPYNKTWVSNMCKFSTLNFKITLNKSFTAVLYFTQEKINDMHLPVQNKT